MESKKLVFSKEIAGKNFKVEIGKLAQQTNGTALVSLEGTTVLATCVMGRKPRQGINYLPLTVDYEEKLYAAGKIKGSRFIKREGRATDEAILAGRLIDRTIRPAFDQNIRRDIQVVATILSFDKINDPDIPAVLAASIALSISDIPWNGPLAAVRVCQNQDDFIINPSYEKRKESESDLIVSGRADNINMIEGEANQNEESSMLKAIEKAQEYIKELINFQKEIIQAINPQKTEIEIAKPSAELVEMLKKFLNNKLEEAIYTKNKIARQSNINQVKEDLNDYLKKEGMESELNFADILFEDEINEIIHNNILNDEKRPDFRKLDEVRDLECDVNILPQTHGSGLFRRGSTQTLSIVTLGGPGEEQTLDNMEIETKKRFFHHYNFPPYSVGETGFFRGPGRREIGHGALAEKTLEKILPAKEDFPYTIRIVSEILSSNGSSSMASVCASSLALMDAGVPIKTAAAGIAMGLMRENVSGKYKVITDIQGPEDHHGDIDLKVAGTKNGICGIQMDVKIEGINLQILKDAFAQAKKARLEIIEKMEQAIKEPRIELSNHAPRIISHRINPDKIRDLIGPGGKMINEIIDKTGADIDIEDDGLVFITAKDKNAAEQALDLVKIVTREIKAGEVFQGKVSRILDFGAFVEIGPKQEGLVHISELAPHRVNKVEDVVKLGDIVTVRVKNIDDLGRLNLTLKK